MAPSNIAVLTKSHNIIASKKRARKDQVKEVVFDEDARREYLTGFHKRNLEKRETAKKKAIEREKQERLEMRREKRKMLAERAVQNAEEVEKAYGAQVAGQNVEWDGLGPSSSGKGKEKAVEHEEAYEDEEQLATVTVVEDFDPDALIHGPSKSAPDSSNGEEISWAFSTKQPSVTPSRKAPLKVKKAQSKTATKAKTIKYQTNAERKVEKSKQQKRRTEKAERAGGKAARKSRNVRGKR